MLFRSRGDIPVAALILGASISCGSWGCNRGEDPKPVVRGDPVVKCDILAPARRFGLGKSSDSKTLFFDQADGGAAGLTRVDLEARMVRNLARDALSYQALSSGLVYLSTEGGVFYLEKGKENPRRLTPENVTALSFAVEEASSTLVYIERKGGRSPKRGEPDDDVPRELYKMALEGGKPESLGEGKHIIGAVPSEKAVLWSRRRGSVARVSPDGSGEKVVDIGPDRSVIGQTKGHVITKQPLESKSKFIAVPFGGGAPVELDFGKPAEDLDWTADGERFFVYDDAPGGAVFEVVGAKVTPLMTTKGPRINDIVALDGDTYATLVEHDVNGNGRSDPADEIELCLIERHASDKVIEIPTRTVPLDKVPLAEKLAPLLKEPDLTGATLTFVNTEDKRSVVSLETPKDGSEDLAALRKRVRDLQLRVNELAGAGARLGVRVHYANALGAESKWIESRGRFQSYAGVGAALTAEPTEYDVDIFPSVGFMTPGAVNYGPALCKGKVKNIGQAPLEKVEATCSYVSEKGRGVLATKTIPLSPAKLAPGATGTYRVIITIEAGDGDFRFALTNDGKELTHFNSFASDRAAKIVAVAVKVFAKTGLRYSFDDIRSSFGDESERIVVTASKAFDTLSEDEQRARATAARDELQAILQEDPEHRVPVKLEVAPSGSSRYPKRRVLSNGRWMAP